MKCNCIKEKEAALVGKEFNGHKVISATIVSGILAEPDFEFLSTSHVELVLEGVNKKKEIMLSHSFCPFCGTSIK